METLRHHKSANPYEAKFGYSRAVRRGPFIFVSGTTSIDPVTGIIKHPSSAYHQSLQIFSVIISALEALNATQNDVVRIRMFVAAEEDTEEVGRALKEVFGGVSPAATMIVGCRFVAADMRVEIEADAVVI